MNTKLLIPIIILIAVLGGVALWWAANQSEEAVQETNQSTTVTPSPSPTQSEATSSASETQSSPTQEYVVTLTANGFEPANIVVPAGTEVQFINQSNGQMWVASDPHPVHTDYSAFDQRQAGDEYSFTFSEPGAYTYHNHLNDSQKGIVLVEE